MSPLTSKNIKMTIKQQRNSLITFKPHLWDHFKTSIAYKSELAFLLHIMRGEGTPEDPRSQTGFGGCDLTSELACLDFFSHIDNSCEGDPGSSSCGRPRTMSGANTECNRGPALWVIPLAPREERGHINSCKGLNWMTDGCKHIF